MWCVARVTCLVAIKSVKCLQIRDSSEKDRLTGLGHVCTLTLITIKKTLTFMNLLSREEVNLDVKSYDVFENCLLNYFSID